MKMKIILFPFHHWIRRDALAGHTDTVLCDMCCKKTCSVFLIMSKIEIGPHVKFLTFKLYDLRILSERITSTAINHMRQ